MSKVEKKKTEPNESFMLSPGVSLRLILGVEIYGIGWLCRTTFYQQATVIFGDRRWKIRKLQYKQSKLVDSNVAFRCGVTSTRQSRVATRADLHLSETTMQFSTKSDLIS